MRNVAGRNSMEYKKIKFPWTKFNKFCGIFFPILIIFLVIFFASRKYGIFHVRFWEFFTWTFIITFLGLLTAFLIEMDEFIKRNKPFSRVWLITLILSGIGALILVYFKGINITLYIILIFVPIYLICLGKLKSLY